MAPAAVTPDSSGTTTPNVTSASTLTQAGIKHQHQGQPFDNPLDASHIRKTLATELRAVPAPESAEVLAQNVCTDHMISARWTQANGWETPHLQPYGPLAIMPNASVLHYATECFEGMKLYRGADGRLRLFRPQRNCERMRRSAARIALPDFDPAALETMITALCAQDGARWLPRERGPGFLYVRPTMIATDPALGVQRPKEALLYVILACFPDMTRNLAPPVGEALVLGEEAEKQKQAPQKAGLRLLASSEDTIRAWPGGFGYAKLGANYGPSLVAQGEARSRGFDQVLWLFGKEAYVTEAGASNFFIVWKSKATGKLQLVTAPLEERIILEGITRASILELARARFTKGVEGLQGLEVVEERFTMTDVVTAHQEGRLVEAFAAGTAFFVAPVAVIQYRGRDIELPSDADSSAYARVTKKWLTDIMYGHETNEWGVVVEES